MNGEPFQAPQETEVPQQSLFSRKNAFQLFLGVVILGCVGLGAFFISSVSKQEDTKIYKVGILSGLDLFLPTVDGFKSHMTSLGYIEGKNIIYDVQRTNFETEKERKIFDDFVKKKMDLILCFPTEVSLQAKAATEGTGIPIIFANAFTDGNTLVNSVKEPGGNITGVRYPGPDLSIKHLEVIRALLPKATYVYTPYLPDYPATKVVLEHLRPAAKEMGFTLVEAPVTSLEELEADLQARSLGGKPKIDAIITMPNTLTASPEGVAVIGAFARKYSILYEGPVAAENPDTAFIVTPDPFEAGINTAIMADKIFHGIAVGSIPVVTPETYLYLNLKVLTALGIPVSNKILNQAKEIIH